MSKLKVRLIQFSCCMGGEVYEKMKGLVDKFKDKVGFKEIDVSSKEAQELIEKYSIMYTPAVVAGGKVFLLDEFTEEKPKNLLEGNN